MSAESFDPRVALLEAVSDFAARKAAPRAGIDEQQERFPRDLFDEVAGMGLAGMPYPEECGGAGLCFETYLEVLEILARAYTVLGLTISVHTLSCFPTAKFGTTEQKSRILPRLTSGEWLGAYCLSEAGSGSDAAALTTRAERTAGGYCLNGAKAWVTHAGAADLYTIMARTSPDGSRGISAFLVPKDAPGMSFGKPEHKMGLRASPTSVVNLEDVFVAETDRVGDEGQGFSIALAALDSGRLGIAACATGLSRAAFEAARVYAAERKQFGKAIAEFQGVSFMLADMLTETEASRALWHEAARRRDAGLPATLHASMAKLHATDAAMRITTDAVQIFGGYGYVSEYPVERYMREAKVFQIFEGTNQIQRVVISRQMARMAEGRRP